MPKNKLVPANDEPTEPEQRPADPLKFFPNEGWKRKMGNEWVKVCGGKCSSWDDDFKRCKNDKTMENGRCYMHGGNTPKGEESPHFKNGRHSQYLPDDLDERYRSLVSDPDLNHLRDEIALLDARITEILQLADLGVSVELFKELADLWERADDCRTEYMDAHAEDEDDRMERAVSELFGVITTMGEHIRGANRDREAWSEVTDLVNERRKLVKAENRRIKQGEEVIDAENARLMITMLQETIRNLVARFVPESKQDEAKRYFHETIEQIRRGNR